MFWKQKFKHWWCIHWLCLKFLKFLCRLQLESVFSFENRGTRKVPLSNGRVRKFRSKFCNCGGNPNMWPFK